MARVRTGVYFHDHGFCASDRKHRTLRDRSRDRRGGFATVYLARETTTDRFVALKLAEGDPATNARVKSELAATQLHHANVVQVFDVGAWDGRVVW